MTHKRTHTHTHSHTHAHTHTHTHIHTHTITHATVYKHTIDCRYSGTLIVTMAAVVMATEIAVNSTTGKGITIPHPPYGSDEIIIN